MNRTSIKGQATQTFTFLSAAIIIGIILLFGGYAILQLLDNVKTIEETQFRQNIERKIDSVSSKYGSVEIFDLTGLQNYAQICVVDLVNPPASGTFSSYPLLQGEVTDKTANFFLLDNSDVADRFLNDNIVVDNGFACTDIDSQGVVKVRLEGLGKVTKVSFITNS